MFWEVIFYSKKVELEVKQWPAGIFAKFLHIVQLIKSHGPIKVGMPHIKPIAQGLFEIRAKGVEGIGRAFFCMVKGKK